MNKIFKLISVIILIIVVSGSNVFSDDIGFTSVRLIQVSDSTYVFEADVTQQNVWAIKAPIFPNRFTVSKIEYINNSGLIIVRVTATSSGEPLNYKDEIVLPWMRNGISLTAQWNDGTLGRGFFRRSLDGIHIPMQVLLPIEKTNIEIAFESFRLGIDHIGFGFIHVLLVLVLYLVFKSRSVFIYLLSFAFGQGFSLIFIEFGVVGFDLLFTEMLLLLLIIMLSVAAVKQITFSYILPVLLLLGLLHGLSANQELLVLNPTFNQEILAAFTFNVVVDIIQFGFALLLIPVFKRLQSQSKFYQSITYIVGVFAVAVMAGLFNQKVITGETDVVKLEEVETVPLNSLPTNKQGQVNNRPLGAVRLTSPIMSYLSVEPFEVRHEILVNAGTALELIDTLDVRMGSISKETQESIKQQVLQLFEKNNPILIDGREALPVLTYIDFVTLGPTGVFVRPEPIRESLDEGIIGITLVYETVTLSKDISINWELFPKEMGVIEATTVDPFGGGSFIITKEDNVLKWKQTLSGYEVPKVEEIAIEKPKLPVVSLVLIVCAIVLLALYRKKYRNTALILLGVALIIYPFLRFSMNVALINQWKPSPDRSAKIIDGLLTNVYRSFDYRNEEAVYDRLSISVMGDQLSQTYIEQRKGLEIENRGGASAKVNDVEVLEVYNVISGDNGDYGIEASWTINGSVSHFGHMHYRQNRYRAIIWIIPNEGNWKIEKIEMIEETRLL